LLIWGNVAIRCGITSFLPLFQKRLLLEISHQLWQQEALFNGLLRLSNHTIQATTPPHYLEILMRQHRLIVPFQLAAAFLAIFLMAVASPKASFHVLYNSEPVPTQRIDPIVTGQTISSDQLEEWKAKRDKFLKCGLCGNAQPFPEDLKD
jgi:hypothetical protein